MKASNLTPEIKHMILEISSKKCEENRIISVKDILLEMLSGKYKIIKELELADQTQQILKTISQSCNQIPRAISYKKTNTKKVSENCLNSLNDADRGKKELGRKKIDTALFLYGLCGQAERAIWQINLELGTYIFNFKEFISNEKEFRKLSRSTISLVINGYIVEELENKFDLRTRIENHLGINQKKETKSPLRQSFMEKNNKPVSQRKDDNKII